jgi:hypothetical protein
MVVVIFWGTFHTKPKDSRRRRTILLRRVNLFSVGFPFTRAYISQSSILIYYVCFLLGNFLKCKSISRGDAEECGGAEGGLRLDIMQGCAKSQSGENI